MWADASGGGSHALNSGLCTESPWRDFPGGPVVKTLRFYCRRHGFDPWSGELRSYMLQHDPKINKRKPSEMNPVFGLGDPPRHYFVFAGSALQQAPGPLNSMTVPARQAPKTPGTQRHPTALLLSILWRLAQGRPGTDASQHRGHIRDLAFSQSTRKGVLGVREYAGDCGEEGGGKGLPPAMCKGLGHSSPVRVWT